MINLLSVEFYKLRRQKAFYGALVILIIFGVMQSFSGLRPITSMDAAVYSICDTSLVFLITLAISVYVGNDFSNRTIHNSIKLGYRRHWLVLSKMLPALGMAAVLQFAFALATVIPVGLRYGFSCAVPAGNMLLWWFVCLVQCCAAESFIVLIGFICRSLSVTMAAGTCFTIVTCNILRNFLESKVFLFSCFHFAEDYSYNALLAALAAAVVVLACVICAAFALFNKAEVK